MSFKLPSFLIKKIFPPKKSVFTVDTTGDGTADSLQLKAINMIQPFTIPEEIDLGDFDVDDFDLSEYAQILLDEMPLDISKNQVNLDSIRDKIRIYHKGDTYTIDDLLNNKAGGKLIAVGDSLSVLIKLEPEQIDELDQGKHTFTINAENIPKLEIEFELTKKNMNVKLNE